MAKQAEHEEHENHEAWVIPYADMLTLLFCLFVILWALANQSNAELSQYKDLAARISAGFSGDTADVPPVLQGAGTSIIDGAPAVGTVQVDTEKLAAAQAAFDEKVAEKQQNEQERKNLEEVRKTIQTAADGKGIGDKVAFRQEARGLVVTIVTDQVLFGPGSADFAIGADSVLQAVTQALLPTSNSIVIEGHTDNRPISSSKFPSNWELSTARSTSVLRYMVDSLGFPRGRVSAAGYGEEHPIAPNDSDEGRSANRRVEMVVLTRAAAAATSSTEAK